MGCWREYGQQKNLKTVSYTHLDVYKRQDEEGKEYINEIAKELRVTASTVILTAFGEVINKWSKNSKFSINMTMLSRDKTIPVSHTHL